MEITIAKVAMPDQLTKKEVQDALKEGLTEWLNERVKMFGWVALSSIAAALLGVLAWFIIQSLGYHK